MSLGKTRWEAAGRPTHGIITPVADTKRNLARYGIVVGTVGDRRHMDAKVAEDHTWYSQTGWPSAALLGWCYAGDIMQPGAGLPTLAQLGAQLVADRKAGLPEVAWIKYINWTDADGHCWHEAWDPTHRRTSSGDRGHIHVSGRTDYRLSTCAAGYDLVARVRGGGGVGVLVPAVLPAVPAYGGRVLRARRPMMHGADVLAAQRRLKARGWAITADGWYGPRSADVVRRFQLDSSRHGWPLVADGRYGPKTHDAAWRRPVT